MKTVNFNPFLFYSQRLQGLLTKATKQKDPALWLYKNDARTVLFMLEALTRLHKEAFEEKLFEKWNKRFKKLEDLLGQIDENAALETDFKKNKKIPAEVIKYFTVHKDNYLVKFNRRLSEKAWLTDKMKAFDEKILRYGNDYNEAYLQKLRAAMHLEIEEVVKFASGYNYNFTKVEAQVHEIRRKLRWLSIYAQALQGLVQLKKSGKRKKQAIHYFTKDILSSPYNKVPVRPKHTAIIELDSDAFFALSWIISELGKLKDTVLNFDQLKDAIYVTGSVTKDEAAKRALDMMGLKASVEADALKQASAYIKTFMATDKVLDHLIVKH